MPAPQHAQDAAEDAPTPPAPAVPAGWLAFWAAVWTALATVWTGNSRITGAVGAWIRRGPVPRLIGLIVAAGFTYGTPYTRRILGVCALAWLTLAVLLGRRPPADDVDEQPATTATRGPADLTRDQVVTALHELLEPTGGVHLKTLGITLGKTLGRGPVPTGEVRALLTLHGIRHRAGVRVPHAGGREGVHRDDVPPLPSPESETAPESVVVPGQSDNNNGNNAPTVTEIGHGGYSVPAPVRPRA